MATLVNKHNQEVKVIIPNMREFRAFYSDNEGVIGMFFKRDWVEETMKKEEHWKPSEEQMKALNVINCYGDLSYVGQQNQLISLYNDLKKLI